MAKHLIRIRLTPEGLRGALKEGFAARETYVRGLTESMGGKIEAWYGAYGEDDIVVIIDAPPAVAIAISFAINQTGTMRLTTTPLLTAAEMDEARGRVPQYRPPGA